MGISLNKKSSINLIKTKDEHDFMIQLDFKKSGGLIPAIVQDALTGQVLMLAYMNQAAFEKTLETKKATYYSRSRNQLWTKGESSGHVQHVKEIRVDCDLDSVVLKVEQAGQGACHKGYRSCFTGLSTAMISRLSTPGCLILKRYTNNGKNIEAGHPQRKPSECNH